VKETKEKNDGNGDNNNPPAAPNFLDIVPDEMPFDVPFGAPISLERAPAAINAVVAEAKKRD
jgi:glc operon protein GlcG